MNVKANPLPNHDNQIVNAILEEYSTKVVSLVEDVRTPWSNISENMQKHDVLAGVQDNCDVCKIGPDRCEKLKDCIQELMDQGVLQFSRDRTLGEISVIRPIEIVYRKKQIEAPIKKVQPTAFHVPSPFPYQNSKVVPWKYNAAVSVSGEEIHFSNAEIVNISGPWRMTLNGCVFSLKYTPKFVPTSVTIPPPPSQEGVSISVPATLL